MICNCALISLSITALLIVWSGQLTFTIILILSFVLGSIFAINFPSMIGMVKDIISEKALFSKTMGAASSNPTIGQIISSSAFTFIYTMFSAIGTFALSLLGNLLALISILMIRVSLQREFLKDKAVISQIKSGLKYVFDHKQILSIIIVSTILSTVFSFVTYEMPVIDSDFLKGGPSYLGILYFAGSAGGIMSGLYLAKKKPSTNLLKVSVYCVFICGVSTIGISVSRLLWLDSIFNVGIDFSIIAVIGISNIILQLYSNDSMRGRVLGVYLSFNWGITAIATMLLGFLADDIGTEAVLNIIGSVAILTGSIYSFIIKDFMRKV